jgi:hypothetical protein
MILDIAIFSLSPKHNALLRDALLYRAMPKDAIRENIAVL